MESKPQKIKCDYIFDKSYNPKYANGAYGGINPTGEIVINFFFERAALPKQQSFVMTEDNVREEIKEDQIPSDASINLVRVVGSGVILQYRQAKDIHEWLGGLIEKIDEAKL